MEPVYDVFESINLSRWNGDSETSSQITEILAHFLQHLPARLPRLR